MPGTTRRREHVEALSKADHNIIKAFQQMLEGINELLRHYQGGAGALCFAETGALSLLIILFDMLDSAHNQLF